MSEARRVRAQYPVFCVRRTGIGEESAFFQEWNAFMHRAPHAIADDATGF